MRALFPTGFMSSGWLTSIFQSFARPWTRSGLAYGRGRLMRLMLKRPDQLSLEQRERLQGYLSCNPIMETMYNFMDDLNDLLRNKAKNKQGCRVYVNEPL